MQAVDLFCGCGGFTQGLLDAGFEIKLGIDYDDKILETYRLNFSHDAVKHNLHDWQGAVDMIRRVTPGCRVVVGSPPCTEFSRAGNQIEGNVADLTVNFARIVTSILPDFFIMENVPDVFHSNSLKKAVDIFNSYGYSICSIVKDARYTGVAQNRRRFFLVGCAATTKNHVFLSQIVKDSKANMPLIGVKEYCTEKNVECPDFLYFFPRNKFQAQVVSTKTSYPTLRSTNGVCMNKKPLVTTNLVKRPNDAADLENAVTMSIPIASAISSFPVDFKWPSGRKDVGIQLGNCVPPGLAEWIGRLVLKNMHLCDELPELDGSWILKPSCKVIKKVSHIEFFLKEIHDVGGDAKSPSIRLRWLVGKDEVSTPSRELLYEIGSGEKAMDLAAERTIGFDLKPGWTFSIKERICQRSRIDDLFVTVPGQPVPFRGKAMLKKNGHL